MGMYTIQWDVDSLDWKDLSSEEIFKRVTETALALHHSMPQIGISNWDLTIDEKGDVVLIEGNLQFGGVWIFQMACGVPVFGEHTAEMLQWVQRMKKMQPSERPKHAFGL